MSKKALELAGRRPALLALIIVATLTLGLLFSGWLAPVPGKAQQGADDPQPDQEATNCVEHGPYWGSWSGSCPSIITNGSVSPTSIDQCGVTAPTMPTNIVVPVYSPTNIWQQIGTYDCTNTVSTNKENITYSVGGVQWDPALPGTVTNTFSSTAYVNVTSSDTNKCASPGRVNLGSVTWSLPCPTITSDSLVEFAPAGSYGAKIAYNFQCMNGWYSWEYVTDANGNPYQDQTAPMPTQRNSMADSIYDAGNPTTNFTDATYQTIYFSADGSTNAVCSFPNTQTIQVIQTNAPNTPPHGIVVTSVTIGGGFSVTNSY